MYNSDLSQYSREQLEDLVSRSSNFVFNALPEEIINGDGGEADMWNVEVVWRGANRWAVSYRNRTLSSDGEFEYESLPSERTDEYKATHRFDFDTAVELAKRETHKVSVNGLTATGYVGWLKANELLKKVDTSKMTTYEKNIAWCDIADSLKADESFVKRTAFIRANAEKEKAEAETAS